MAHEGWERSGSRPVGGLRPDQQGGGEQGPLSPGGREQAGLPRLQEEGTHAVSAPRPTAWRPGGFSQGAPTSQQGIGLSWVGRDRALSPPERAKPGSPLPPGGEGACRPWQAACMAQTSSLGPPPALGPENGPFVGSGLDGQLTWPGRQLPARSRWPGPHGEGCGGSRLEGPRGQGPCAGPACAVPWAPGSCWPGGWDGASLCGRLPRAPAGLLPRRVALGWQLEAGVCVSCRPAGWPRARPARPFSLECSPGGRPPPSPALPQVQPAVPAPGFSGRSGDMGWFPFCGLQGQAALKSALAARAGPRTGQKP